MTDPSALSSVDLSSAVSVAVARKALDAQKAEGSQVVEMIRQAGEVGQQARRSAEAAKAGGVDLYA